MDVKENLATNLARYRKDAKLTQIELAEKLNYSDKAVSKWERGESVPDLYVLKQLADFYGVTIDTLISEPKKEKPKTYKKIPLKRIIISFSFMITVVLLAIFYYAIIGIVHPEPKVPWISFIYALPIIFLVLFILTSVWGKTITRGVIASLLSWTTILSVFLSLLYFLPYPPKTLWLLFLIGIPIQILIILWVVYKKAK